MIEYGEKVKIDFPFFSVPAGSTYRRIEGTYELNVCDCCGKKRSCDLYAAEDWSTLLDLCRNCKKTHAEMME